MKGRSESERRNMTHASSLDKVAPFRARGTIGSLSQKHFIMTSRFNNTTWQENRIYRTHYPKFGCIYCAPCQISMQVPINATMFILEMNNEENCIMGIGMVKNHSSMHALSVYSNCNYNRYQYYGKHRIDRYEMTDEEETIMRVFDILCFTGNSHQKRGNGLKMFPLNMLRRCLRIMDLVDFIYHMFRTRYFPQKIEFINCNGSLTSKP